MTLTEPAEISSALTDLLLRTRVEEAYRAEAAQLDAHRMAEWLEWLHPEFRYEVPIPVARDDPGQPQYSSTGFLAVEVRGSIELWVQRVSGDLIELAYAENPPVRTRHFVTNVGIARSEETGHLHVVSNVLVTWSRRSDPPLFASGERHDVLVDRGDGGLLLRSRRVLLDSEVVHLSHLRVIF